MQSDVYNYKSSYLSWVRRKVRIRTGIKEDSENVIASVWRSFVLLWSQTNCWKDKSGQKLECLN